MQALISSTFFPRPCTLSFSQKSTKQIPGTDAWLALRRSNNGHLLLQRTDRHTSEGDARSYVGINLWTATTELPSGKAGETWKYSPGNPALDDLPSSQFDVTIRLDCCGTIYGPLGGEAEGNGYLRTIKKVTWGTPGPWSNAPGLGSTCGLDANGFPNGVRKRLVKCGGQPDCQTCAYTDGTDKKPATRDFNFYACGTVAPTTTTTPCPNVPHTITEKTKISCSAQGTQYRIGVAVCGATPPCQCDGNNQGSTILDQTKPCCEWQGSLGATLPGSKCGQQPQALITYTCHCADCIGSKPTPALVASGSPTCCPTFWEVIGGWQNIKDECGENGLQQARNVNCYQRTDDGTEKPTTNGCACLETKPVTERSFNGPACTTSTSTSTKTTATATATTATSTTTTQTTVTTVTTTTIYDPQNVDCVEVQDACTPECQPSASRNYKILVQQAEQGRACVGPTDCDPGTDACPTAEATQAAGNQTATVELATNILLDAQVRLDAAKAAVLQGLADPSVSADVRATLAAVLAGIAAADVQRSSISDAIAGAADSSAVFQAVDSTGEDRNALTAQVAAIEAALSAAINFVPAKTNIPTGATDDGSDAPLPPNNLINQDRQPSASSAAAVAVPVVLLLLLTIVIIVYALRRQQEKAQQNQFFQPAAPTRRTSARTNSKDELEQNEALEMTDNPLSTANRRIPTDTGTASTADGGGLGQAGAEGSDGYLVVHQSGGEIYTYAPPAGESAGAPVVQYAVPLDPNDRGGAEATYQVPALRPAFVGAADGNVGTFTPSTRPVPAEVYSAPSSGGNGQAVAAATSTPCTPTNDGRKTPAASGAVDTPGAVYLVPSELAAIRSGDGGDGGASGGVDSKTIHSTAASVKLVPGAESSNADGNSNAIIYAVPVEDAPSASHHLHVARTPNILYAPFDPDAPEGIPGGVQRFPNPLYNSAGGAGNAPNQQRGQAEEQAAVSFQTSGVPANSQVYAQPLNAASAAGVAGSADADTYTGYEAPADPALDAERPDHNNTYDQWGAQAASVTDALTASSEL